jgi:hypothetical protein
LGFGGFFVGRRWRGGGSIGLLLIIVGGSRRAVFA